MVRVNSEPVYQMRRVPQPSQVAVMGLLIAAIFVGSMGVAMRARQALSLSQKKYDLRKFRTV